MRRPETDEIVEFFSDLILNQTTSLPPRERQIGKCLPA